MLTVDFMSRALSDAVTVITLHFAVSLKMPWENRDY